MKKNAIKQYLEEIKNNTDDLDDPNALDRVLSLLTQASAGHKVKLASSDGNLKFNKKDHFYPTQRNETQLKFCKTAGNPGRRQKYVQLR